MKRIYISRDQSSQYTGHTAVNSRAVRAELPRGHQLCSRDIEDDFHDGIMDMEDGAEKQIILHFIAVERSISYADTAGSIAGYIGDLQSTLNLCREKAQIPDHANECEHRFFEDDFGVVRCRDCGAFDVVSQAAMNIKEAREKSDRHGADQDRQQVLRTCEESCVNFTEPLLNAAVALANRIMCA